MQIYGRRPVLTSGGYCAMQHTCCMLPWNAATRPSIVCLSWRGVMTGRPQPPLQDSSIMHVAFQKHQIGQSPCVH